MHAHAIEFSGTGNVEYYSDSTAVPRGGEMQIQQAQAATRRGNADLAGRGAPDGEGMQI